MSRVETTRGVFVVIGSPSEVQQQLNGTTAPVTRSKKVLKD
jgi:hypothetical protein